MARGMVVGERTDPRSPTANHIVQKEIYGIGHGGPLCACGNPSGEVKTCSHLCCADCGRPTMSREGR